MKKNEDPHEIRITLVKNEGLQIEDAICKSCPKGKGKACGHVIAVLYHVMHLKAQGMKAIPTDVAKTSLPQVWHQPTRGAKIGAINIQNMVVIGYSSKKASAGSESYFTGERSGIKSTLYNPLRSEPGDITRLKSELHSLNDRTLILPALEQAIEGNMDTTLTKFGRFPKGSALAVQQKLSSDYILNSFDGVDYPRLPHDNSSCISFLECTPLFLTFARHKIYGQPAIEVGQYPGS